LLIGLSHEKGFTQRSGERSANAAFLLKKSLRFAAFAAPPREALLHL
jgi:hypothetical protein